MKNRIKFPQANEQDGLSEEMFGSIVIAAQRGQLKTEDDMCLQIKTFNI